MPRQNCSAELSYEGRIEDVSHQLNPGWRKDKERKSSECQELSCQSDSPVIQHDIIVCVSEAVDTCIEKRGLCTGISMFSLCPRE